ncbi:hypothetical protein BO79DRAFT_230962 [Aspergillus costaricaensis CBS 115574]|uniref:Uncharacterized protein n=1 Tax=Aspergillus costaricaensis CBS 115574 TaxID=1448317 RepID=A0ACD1I5Z5_9EURO|nr:hypothetical protein BO79DRAFT_230962 [Aspergillus costaricaensis CBS 115574]RAK85914.1 hypothetical protein BO79DRAFT_230962 [Aspergillus costaricaensis CBS 115574]
MQVGGGRCTLSSSLFGGFLGSSRRKVPIEIPVRNAGVIGARKSTRFCRGRCGTRGVHHTVIPQLVTATPEEPRQCLPKAEVLNQTVKLAGMGPLYSVRTVWVGQNETFHNPAIHSIHRSSIRLTYHTKRVDGPGKAGA